MISRGWPPGSPTTGGAPLAPSTSYTRTTPHNPRATAYITRTSPVRSQTTPTVPVRPPSAPNSAHPPYPPSTHQDPGEAVTAISHSPPSPHRSDGGPRFEQPPLGVPTKTQITRLLEPPRTGAIILGERLPALAVVQRREIQGHFLELFTKISKAQAFDETPAAADSISAIERDRCDAREKKWCC